MKKYLFSVRTARPPEVDEIPFGMWAEKSLNELNWKIYTLMTREQATGFGGVPNFVRSKY